jgi:predicted O-methyltransferase YrrM
MPVRALPLPVTNVHALGRNGTRVWAIGRHLVPRVYRELYEGHRHIPGQMWFEDRRVLFNAVREMRPRRCFEIGTWLGGGSTLVVARALTRNGFGKLHTIEVEDDLHTQAKAFYAKYLPELLPFVEFHRGDYRTVFPDLIEREGGVDFFVLDGAEDGAQTLAQFEFFAARSHAGTALFAHDWETEKAAEVRPLLESSEDWEIDTVVGPPKSVGLAVARRLGSPPQ